MIKSCVTISLVPEAQGGPFIFWHDLMGSCQQAAQAGFDAIELFAPCAESVEKRALVEALSRYDLELAGLGTGAGFLLHKLHLSSPDTKLRRIAREFIGSIIDVAGSLGAFAIIGSMQGLVERSMERSTALVWLREALNELGPRAQRYEVPLILEPLNRYETNLINRLDQGVELIESLQTDNVKLLADLFHMNIEETSIGDALRRAAPYIAHIHFVDSNRQPPGCGHTDFAAVGRVLQEIGYEGYVSVEALAYPTPQVAARQAMRTFRHYLVPDP